jgi:hypothetical protein
MERTFIGIDPGVEGFITVMFPNGSKEFYSIAEHDDLDIHRVLKNIKERSWEVSAVMEEVHAIFGATAKSTFNFGEINGILKGLLIANEIPYTLVQPKIWQGEIWNNQDMIVSYKTIRKSDGTEQKRKVVDTKSTSINAARRLFPSIDLRKNERCKKVDDNKVDSLLLAEYARRKNL